MNTEEVAASWYKHATVWTTTDRLGFDVCRNHLNTPGFMNMLPGVKGLKGLNVGFALERFFEPCPDAETLEKYPAMKGTDKDALFLHIRCRKPL
ncbi:MAG: hypothetical protein IT342_07930 [Candidatus Melainabacteria bacterium]|nr:hypothetical protein [Candidatus Melainabacteria bacterium]